ncbi:MAG: alanine acetyltransferase, partial [Planctomycetota bacterium]
QADLYLEVREGNREAQDFYRALGFTVVGGRKKYYRQPEENAVIMKQTASMREAVTGAASGAPAN